jgi:hypothetical protein
VVCPYKDDELCC